jgi:hypothetical protein
MPTSQRRRGLVLACVLAAACARERTPLPTDRGAGLPVATLSDADRAAAYAVVLRGTFDIAPGLVLLLDRAVLPRGRDEPATDTLSAGLARALAATGVTQGTCVPVSGAGRVAPICPGAAAGYAVRFSDPYQGGKDTIQVFVTAERFRPSRDTTGRQPPLRLEQRYSLRKRGTRWEVARKDRLVQ